MKQLGRRPETNHARKMSRLLKRPPKQRLCLMSDPDVPHRFLSHSAGERVCPDCKHTQRWKGATIQ